MKKFERELVRGWLHEPHAPHAPHEPPQPAANPAGKGVVITHGAGSNCDSALLRSVAEAFAGAGFHVLRCDLPYRQQRPTGPPLPAFSARDREGLHRAVQAMREVTPDYVLLGGHSYGGRQATLLAAEVPAVANALLLLSYPLHPPRKPEQVRTAHFPQLHTPALFIHGSRDPFGSIQEMSAALAAIPSRHSLIVLDKTGHELSASAAPVILRETVCFANA